MRLTHIDSSTKTKVLLDVVWCHLKGNNHPYLSVDIKQVTLKGDRLWDHFAKVEALKEIDQDFYFLAKNHLKNDQGGDMHMTANSVYFCKEFLKQKAEGSNIETLDKLSDKTGLTIEQLKNVLFCDDIEKEITPLLKDRALQVNEQLKLLTDKYKINLVIR